MNLQNSILEIGCEELPCGFLRKLELDLPVILADELVNNHLISRTSFYLTPRRIIVYLERPELTATEVSRRVKGPKSSQAYEDGKPTRILEGFLRSKGATESELVEENGYLLLDRKEKLPELTELLPVFFTKILCRIYLPKSMFWLDKKSRFIRPVRWVVAMLGERVLDLTLFGIKAGNQSFGHRFLSEGAFSLDSAENLLSGLSSHGVEYDQRKRFEMIRENVERLSGEWNEKLGWENTFLVEKPYVFTELMPEKFLSLPREVLTTVMNKQQRYFPCVKNGSVLPEFVIVANNEPTEFVRDGNLKVLNARLSDASFFFRNDLAENFEAMTAGLSEMVFHQGLGTLTQKVQRIGKLAGLIQKAAFPEYEPPLPWEKMAPLLKVDMLTEMVFEFPELQGRMGGIYLSAKGYPADLCRAVSEHYFPQGQLEELPETIAGAVFALSDKLDTLIAFFSAGIIPTGSKDPFALRRMALGLLKILNAKKMMIPLETLISQDFELLAAQFSDKKGGLKDPSGQLTEFLAERFYHMLKDEFPYDLIEAVCETGFSNPYDSYLRLRAISELSKTSEFRDFSLLALRINNIIKGQNASEPDPVLMNEPAERELWNFFISCSPEINRMINVKNYQEAFNGLLKFSSLINVFFEKVMVNCEDLRVKQNRIAILHKLQSLFLKLVVVEKIASKNERRN
ncbi:MAG: glycine--tRNA ligase subunit beta [Candidatus Wallbacteria bacterium]|nr:glycine--tRNA ligase subunit beta [Candidatus Wallbacteria bacterium]